MKVLVLSPFPPRHDAPHGGSRWIAGLVPALARSHSVALVTLRGPGEDGVDKRIREVCDLVVEVERRTARASFANVWRERQRLALAASGAPGWAVGFSVRAVGGELERVVATWQPDVAHVESFVMAQHAGGLRPVPVVVVDQDAADTSAAMRRFRARVLRDADAVVALTERDQATLAALVPSARIERIPLAVDLRDTPLDPAGSGRDVLFVGNFIHPPNVEAAERLVQSIFPRVAARRADARLVIVGDGSPASLQSCDNVVVMGRVADLDPVLDAAAVVVAPLTSGGGMRVKVLDALGAGKAVVASPLALEGIAAGAGEVVVADGDDEFADAIVALLDDGSRRAELGRAARAWAETNVGWSAIVEAYDALYASLVNSSRDDRPARGRA
ncbi:MAG TPA: glycosyltransferase [Gaiellaceae bacterium]|jgi:glycosyltransferase involved in cell wall biosynthesis